MSESPVTNYLKDSNRVWRIAGLASLILGLACVVGSASLVFVLADAVLNLPAVARVIIDLGLLGSAAWLAIKGFGCLWQEDRQLRRTAHRVERRAGLGDNELISAAEFVGPQRAGISRSLVSAAVQRGNRVAQGLRTTILVPSARLGQVGLATLLLLSSGLVVAWWAPGLVERVVPRFLDPWGNHPAYTSLHFDISIAPQQVAQGDTVHIAVSMDGPWPPDTAKLLVFQSKANAVNELPMTPTESGDFQIDLRDVRDDLRIQVETPRGTSDRVLVPVWPVPTFKRVSTAYQFPAYTQLKSVVKPLTSAGIDAWQATEIDLLIESDIDLEQATCSIATATGGDSSQVLRPEPNQPRKLVVKMKLFNQTNCQISLTSKQGVKSRDRLTIPIRVREDRPPSVEILSPEQETIAVEGWQVPVSVRAVDDLHLKEVTLDYQLDEQASEREGLYDDSDDSDDPDDPDDSDDSDAAGPRNLVQIEYEFDLQTLQAGAGTTISYHVQATDCFPETLEASDAHQVSTGVHTIHVVSLAHYRELARQEYRIEQALRETELLTDQLHQLQEEREALINELEKQLPSRTAEAEPSDDASEPLERSLERLTDYADRISELHRWAEQRANWESIYDFEDTYKRMLQQLAEQLREQQSDAEQLAAEIQRLSDASDPASRMRALAELENLLDQFRDNRSPFADTHETDRDQFLSGLKTLGIAEALLQSVAGLKYVVETQREIAERLREVDDDGRDPSHVERQQQMLQLAKQQDLLKQELVQLMRAIDEVAPIHAGEFPQACQSLQKMVATIRSSAVAEDQRRAADFSRTQNSTAAWQFAQLAAEKLERLQCDCHSDSLGANMKQAGDGPLTIPKSKMSSSLRQIEAALSGKSPVNNGRRSGAGDWGDGVASRTLLGPHPSSRRKSITMPGSGRHNQGPESWGSAGFESRGRLPDEVLEPSDPTTRNFSALPLNGVPTQFLDHAKAYLQRLSDESAQKPGGGK